MIRKENTGNPGILEPAIQSRRNRRRAFCQPAQYTNLFFKK
jgi:hypothetical protein